MGDRGEGGIIEQQRYVSYGGGVQSTALLVLAAQGKIDFRTFLFADVGAESENPGTLRYIREVAMPYARHNGLRILRLRRHKRDGSVETLMQRIERSKKTIAIPAHLGNGAGMINRNCTVDFKIKVISKWLRLHGVTKDLPALMAIGISLDEAHRMRKDSREPLQTTCYPLVEMRLDRQDCEHIIRDAGLPIPPKSSCFYCPFHSLETWRRLRRDEPDLFDKAVVLEEMLGDRSSGLKGRDGYYRPRVYLSGKLKPLPMVISSDRQLELFEDSPLANCESGYCMT